MSSSGAVSGTLEEPSSFDARTLDLEMALRRYARIGNHWLRYQFVKQLVSNCRVLELGCGFGLGATVLADSVSEYLGVDSFEPGIEWARKRVTPFNGRLAFRTLPEFLGVSSGRHFDVGLAFEVLEHVSNPRELLTDLVSRVRPGGTLVLSTPNGYYSQHDGRLFRTPFHTDEYTPSEVLALLSPLTTVTQLYAERRWDRLDVFWLAMRRKLVQSTPNASVRSSTDSTVPSGLVPAVKRIVYESLNDRLFWEIVEIDDSIHPEAGFSTIVAVSVVK